MSSASDAAAPYGYTYTEAWRHECEVRQVVRMATPELRRAYLDGVERFRGKAAAERLREGVRAAWAQNRPGQEG